MHVLAPRLRTIAGCLMLAVWAGLLTNAPQAQASGGRVVGRITILRDGAPYPVRRARVALEPVGQSAREVIATHTDTEGDYEFHDVTPGLYRVSVVKPGFVVQTQSASGIVLSQPLSVTKGAISQHNIRMRAAGALEGAVTNELGQPVSGATVTAFRLGYSAFARSYRSNRSTTTDDAGRFRLHTLYPGDYTLYVAPRLVGVVQETGTVGTYYPSVHRADAAGILTVLGGQEITDLDVVATSTRLWTIAGKVVDSSGDPPSSTVLRLAPVTTGPPTMKPIVRLAENHFTIRNVPPGRYWLLATSRARRSTDAFEYAALMILVEGQDTGDVELVTNPGSTIVGRVEFEEAPVALPAGIHISAVGTEYDFHNNSAAGPTAAATAALKGDGTFVIENVVGPCLIRLTRLPEWLALRNVWMSGQDVTENPVSFPVGRSAVRIVLTAQLGTVVGTVDDSAKAPVAGARVLLFADTTSRIGVNSRFIKAVDTDAQGLFRIAGVIPGTYYIVALDYLEEGAWYDADVISRLKHLATTVDLQRSRELTQGCSPESGHPRSALVGLFVAAKVKPPAVLWSATSGFEIRCARLSEA